MPAKNKSDHKKGGQTPSQAKFASMMRSAEAFKEESAKFCAMFQGVQRCHMNTKPTPVNIDLNKVAVIVDDSGSVASPLQYSKTILEEEIAMTWCITGLEIKNKSLTCQRKTVLFSSDALLLLPGEFKAPRYDFTKPAAIFKDKACLEHIETCSVAVVHTDGIIETPDVLQFSELGSSYFRSISLAIAHIVTQNLEATPFHTDISVVAPVLLAESSIVIVQGKIDTRIVQARGPVRTHLEILGLLPVDLTGTIQWTDLPQIKSLDTILKDLKVTPRSDLTLGPSEIITRTVTTGTSTNTFVIDLDAKIPNEVRAFFIFFYKGEEKNNFCFSTLFSDVDRSFGGLSDLGLWIDEVLCPSLEQSGEISSAIEPSLFYRCYPSRRKDQI
jgi:hypothetical protein